MLLDVDLDKFGINHVLIKLKLIRDYRFLSSHCQPMKRSDSNLKYIMGENNFPRFSRVKRSFNRASRRRHVYKMDGMRSNTMTDGYSSHASCGKEVFHIPVDISTFTCATCGMERKCYCVDVSTRIQDVAATSMSVPGRHRSSISYDVQINAIYRHPTIISATNREWYFRLKKKAFVLIKR